MGARVGELPPLMAARRLSRDDAVHLPDLSRLSLGAPTGWYVCGGNESEQELVKQLKSRVEFCTSQLQEFSNKMGPSTTWNEIAAMENTLHNTDAEIFRQEQIYNDALYGVSSSIESPPTPQFKQCLVEARKHIEVLKRSFQRDLETIAEQRDEAAEAEAEVQSILERAARGEKPAPPKYKYWKAEVDTLQLEAKVLQQQLREHKDIDLDEAELFKRRVDFVNKYMPHFKQLKQITDLEVKQINMNLRSTYTNVLSKLRKGRSAGASSSAGAGSSAGASFSTMGMQSEPNGASAAIHVLYAALRHLHIPEDDEW